MLLSACDSPGPGEYTITKVCHDEMEEVKKDLGGPPNEIRYFFDGEDLAWYYNIPSNNNHVEAIFFFVRDGKCVRR